MTFQDALFLYIVIILSSIIHEYAHGWMAYYQGDPTAKYAGRLTLNPIPHLDLFGTVLLPLFLLYFAHFFFGYAKPVPINPNNFRDQRKGLLLVSLAGPGSNLLIALILGLVIRFSPSLAMGDLTIGSFLAFIVFVNIWLALFNLIPVPPLDGSKLLYSLSTRFSRSTEFLQGAGSWFGIAIALAIAFFVMPTLANLIFQLITGGGIAI